MINEFESNNKCATSTPVENEFKNLKKLLHIRTKRVDIFGKKYIEYVDGQMKFKKAKQESPKAESPLPKCSRPGSNSFDTFEPSRSYPRRSSFGEAVNSYSSEDDLQIMENWRNKVKKSSHALKMPTPDEQLIRFYRHAIQNFGGLTFNFWTTVMNTRNFPL